jgi:uracil-DNA glycosylase family 4
MDQIPSERQWLALLAWYREMGVHDAVAEQPTDWLARGDVGPGEGFELPPRGPSDGRFEPVGPSPPAPAPIPVGLERRAAPPVTAGHARQFPTVPPEAAELAARSAARSAATLEELRRILEQFDGCALKATAKNLCFYRGSPRTRVMLIGEAPGRDEDIEGRPFVGRAGQLLDRMLAAIRLDETSVHITNIVYWRPPGNRTPTPQEAQICRPFLERQMELVMPDTLVLLGGVAAKHVLDVTEGIMRLRGKWREVQVGGRTVKAMATLHPAYLLRSPAHKRLAWRDLLAIRSALQSSR